MLLFTPIPTYPCAIVVLAHSSVALRARLLMYWWWLVPPDVKYRFFPLHASM